MFRAEGFCLGCFVFRVGPVGVPGPVPVFWANDLGFRVCSLVLSVWCSGIGSNVECSVSMVLCLGLHMHPFMEAHNLFMDAMLSTCELRLPSKT
jgi:hypothetical protein